jgi:hypothetical protein
MLQIFSGKFKFSAELFNYCSAVSNFQRNAQRSAEDLNFRLKFSIFPGCFEFSAELLQLWRHFKFSPRCDFFLLSKPEAAKKEEPAKNRSDSFGRPEMVDTPKPRPKNYAWSETHETRLPPTFWPALRPRILWTIRRRKSPARFWSISGCGQHRRWRK